MIWKSRLVNYRISRRSGKYVLMSIRPNGTCLSRRSSRWGRWVRRRPMNWTCWGRMDIRRISFLEILNTIGVLFWRGKRKWNKWSERSNSSTRTRRRWRAKTTSSGVSMTRWTGTRTTTRRSSTYCESRRKTTLSAKLTRKRTTSSSPSNNNSAPPIINHPSKTPLPKTKNEWCCKSSAAR